jgi:hypothetical protein
MMNAMQLVDSEGVPGGHDDPNALIPIQTTSGEVIEATPEQLAAEGLAFAARDMSKNGIFRPNHIGRAKKMTKSQLEEQKMNEREGLPSNLDEAQRVKELEGNMQRMEQMITGMMEMMSRNAIDTPSSPVPSTPNVPTGGHQEFPDVVQIPPSTPQYEQPSQSPTGSTVCDESKRPQIRITEDGRKVALRPKPQQETVTTPNVPPVTLGATGNQSLMEMYQNRDSNPQPAISEEPDVNGGDLWSDDVLEQPEEEPVQNDPKLIQTQAMLEGALQYLRANDVHRYFRRSLTGIHRHLGYSGWDKELQGEFDARFHAFLNDPVFVANSCQKLMRMEYGRMLGAKQVASFIVTLAGYTAFTMCGLN